MYGRDIYDRSASALQGELKPHTVLFLQGCFVEAVNHEKASPKQKFGIEIIISEGKQKF